MSRDMQYVILVETRHGDIALRDLSKNMPGDVLFRDFGERVAWLALRDFGGNTSSQIA